MKNIIEELRKYPDCEMMVVLHGRLIAEIDGHIAKMWSLCRFVEDADGTFVAPFPEGPMVDEIVKVFPQLDDAVKEVIIELMGAFRSTTMLEQCWNTSINEISKAEQDVLTAMKTCIRNGIPPNDARNDPKVKAALHSRDIVMRIHQSRTENLRDRIDHIKLILRKYETEENDTRR